MKNSCVAVAIMVILVLTENGLRSGEAFLPFHGKRTMDVSDFTIYFSFIDVTPVYQKKQANNFHFSNASILASNRHTLILL